MSTVSSSSSRLQSYCILAAGAIPASVAAGGGIIGQTGLNINVNVGSPVSIDFGGQFGEVFQFGIDASGGQWDNTFTYQCFYSTTYGGTTFIGTYFRESHGQNIARNDNIYFAPAGGWTRGSFMGYYGDTYVRNLMDGAQVNGSPNSNSAWQQMNGGHALMRFYDSTYGYSIQTCYGGGWNSQFYTSGRVGPWAYAPGFRGYTGLRFSDNGTDFYYAWIDVSVDFAGSGMTIHGWGLNTNANESIEAGQIPAPGGLAALALGAAGLRRSRKRAG